MNEYPFISLRNPQMRNEKEQVHKKVPVPQNCDAVHPTQAAEKKEKIALLPSAEKQTQHYFAISREREEGCLLQLILCAPNPGEFWGDNQRGREITIF